MEIGNLTKAQCDRLLSVLCGYKDVPIAIQPYQYSLKEKGIIESEVQKMLKLGIIETSTAPWSAPVVLVRKKDNSIRFCVDYRKLNAATISDTFPLPRLEDTLDAFTGQTIFTTSISRVGTGRFYWHLLNVTKRRLYPSRTLSLDSESVWP